MADETEVPIIKCFKNNILKYEIKTSAKEKFIFDKKEYSDFDWLEIIEPAEEGVPKKRVLISCTQTTQKNVVKITEKAGKHNLEITCQIRNLCDSTKNFELDIKAIEESHNSFCTFKINSIKMNGKVFEDPKMNPFEEKIHELEGAHAKDEFSKLPRFSIKTLTNLGLGTKTKIKTCKFSNAFLFVNQKSSDCTSLKATATITDLSVTVKLDFNCIDISSEISTIEFGQQGRVKETRSKDRRAPFAFSGMWTVWSSGYKSAGLLNSWNKQLVEPYYQYLYEKSSLVPKFSLAGDDNGFWCLPAQIRDLAPNEALNEETRFDSNKDPFEFTPNGKIGVHFGPFQPVSPINVQIEFTKWKNQSTGFLKLTGQIKPLIPDGGSKDIPEILNFDDSSIAGMVWIYPQDQNSKKSKSTNRVGAFELVFPEQKSTNFSLNDNALPYSVSKFSGRLGSQVKVSFEANMPLMALSLAGQDRDPRELIDIAASGRASESLKDLNRFDSLPIVIPIDSKDATVRNIFASVSENNFLPGEPRTTIRIKKNNNVKDTEAQDLSAVILDNSPFSVVQIEAKNLFAITQDERDRNEIAIWTNWDPDGTGWKLLSTDHTFDIILPPQSIGEEFIKSKEKADNEIFKYNYSPVAKFSVQTDDESRRFATSPWNIRKILGFPSDRVVGCKLRSMQFELLYGLACEVRSKSLSLTELFSKLGWTPDFSEKELKFKALEGQLPVYEEKVDEWNKIKRSVQSRMSIYMPTMADKKEFNLTEDLDFHIRKQAQLKYPISDKSIPVGDSRRTSAPFKEDGLQGGVTWGFESANVLDSLMREPNSTSGKLVEPHFSALGGWGYQKAEFLGGLTKIYSNTSMGRTFFYSIERLGRIAIFGNLAKHVIIYERTVSPSEQFYMDQNEFLGLPAVRKIKEFIEILEPTRAFPDTKHETSHRGFTKSIEFNSNIIFVKSDWGKDVKNVGWEVPLWNRTAAEFQPSLYTKPLVALNCIVPNKKPEDIEKTEPILIENPEMLYFYTNTTSGASSNPHEWSIVPAVDFPIFPLPHIDNFLLDSDYLEVNKNLRLPGPSSVCPGMERFTFKLVDSSTEANLCAGRTPQGLGSQVQTVTLSRSYPKSVTLDNQLLYLAPLRDYLNQLDFLLSKTPDKFPSKERIEVLLSKEIIKKLEKYIDQLPKIKNIKSSLDAKIELLVTSEVSQICAKILDYIEPKVDNPLDLLRKQIRAVGNKAIKDKEEMKRVIREKLLLLDLLIPSREVLTPLVNSHLLLEISLRLKNFRRELETYWEEVEELIDEVSNLDILKDELKKFFTDLKTGLKNFISAVNLVSIPYLSQEQKLLTDQVKQIVAAIDVSITEIDAFSNIASVKTWFSIKKKNFFTEYDKLQASLVAAVRTLQKGFERLIELQKILRSPSKYFSDILCNVVDSGLTTVEKLISDIDEKLAEVKGDIKSELNDFVKNLDITKIDLYKRIIDETFSFSPEKLKEIINKADSDISKLREDLKKEFFDKIDTFEKEISEHLQREFKSNIVDLASLEDSAYNLQSAVCKQLNNPPFNLNRDAYRALLINEVLEPVKEAIITPCLGLINKAEGELAELKALGARLPIDRLSDRALANFKENLPFSNFVSEFAGTLQKGLLPDLLSDPDWSKKFILTQGIDERTLTAWFKCTIHLPIHNKTLFEKSPVKVLLTSGELYAESLFTAKAQGALQQTTNAHIMGDWLISVYNEEIIEFQKTKLYNDAGGNLRFDISPSRINLKGVMGSISDLMAKIPGAESAFEIARVLKDLDKPISIDCDFDLELPDITGGCFSIKGLKLNAGLGISVIPTDFESFAISSRLSVGRKVAPFSLTIYFLGGGGWFEFASSYLPMKNRIATFLSIGIAVGASFDIVLGPIKGGVTMMIGVGCEFTNDGAGNSTFGVVVIFTLRGEVDLCGIVSAYICLSLSLTYERGGGSTRLIGRGHLEVEIEICWCFTLSLDYDCEYTFIGGKEKKQLSLNSKKASPLKISDLAKLYVDSLN